VRDGDADVAVLEELAQPRLFGGQVQLQGLVVCRHPQDNLEAALLLALLEERIGSDADAACLEVDLAVQDPHVEHVGTVVQTVVHRVDVRQLLTVRVDLPEVRVALHDEQLFGERVRSIPWICRGAIGVQVPEVAVVVIVVPGVKAGGLVRGLQGGLVVGQLHVVLLHDPARTIRLVRVADH